MERSECEFEWCGLKMEVKRGKLYHAPFGELDFVVPIVGAVVFAAPAASGSVIVVAQDHWSYRIYLLNGPPHNPDAWTMSIVAEVD